MKRIFLSVAVLSFVFASCSDASAPKEEDSNVESMVSNETDDESVGETGVVSPMMFGAEITVEEVTSKEDFYAQLETADTLRDIVVSGKIAKVCQKKGCWMKVDLGEDELVFVKFLDYEYFMPKDSDGSTAILQGNAYSETVSVKDLQHYAEDAGKSEEEIAAITEPETTYSFMASGVILKDYVSKGRHELPSEEAEEHDHSEEGHSH